MNRPRSVILDAAEATVLYETGSLVLLRPCPSQPFVEKYQTPGGAEQARATETPETRGIWDGVPSSEKLWHVWYPGPDGGGHGIYESKVEMLTEYRPVMLRLHPGAGAVLNVREPWQFDVLTDRGYLYASRGRSAVRWNSPAVMPRDAVHVRARVESVEIEHLWIIAGAMSERDPLKSLIDERVRRGLPVRGSSWWDTRSFANRARGTLHEQDPYVYVTLLAKVNAQ